MTRKANWKRALLFKTALMTAHIQGNKQVGRNLLLVQCMPDRAEILTAYEKHVYCGNPRLG